MPRLAPVVALAVLAAAVPGRVAAQDVAAAWRQLTVADVEFAHRLLAENHPGAAPEVADTAFVRRLAEARTTALARVARVADWNGYHAVMQGMAYAMGDKHIWMNAAQRPVAYRWAGAIVSLRGDRWVITGGDSAVAPIGAMLLACDGEPIAAFAERRLGSIRAVWSVEAQRIAAAPLLLVDEGDPFVPAPRACTVDDGTGPRPWTPAWRPVSRTALLPLVSGGAPHGAPGFGVRRVGPGWWIAMQSLNASAAAVLDTVRSLGAAIREAPRIVVDVRGNGGGNSQFGTELAGEIWGAEYVAAVSRRLGGGGEECGTVFRASPGNLEAWGRFVERLREQGNEAGATAFAPALEEMRTALAEGRTLSGPACPPSSRPASAATGERPSLSPEVRALSRYGGTVVLLTDHTCFSSCLLLSELFRALGAVHVGETTDANTHYMEVREAELPSGLGKFSTLQKVALGVPREIGPYRPDHPFPGDISDTAALEAWVDAGFPAR